MSDTNDTNHAAFTAMATRAKRIERACLDVGISDPVIIAAVVLSDRIEDIEHKLQVTLVDPEDDRIQMAWSVRDHDGDPEKIVTMLGDRVAGSRCL